MTTTPDQADKRAECVAEFAEKIARLEAADRAGEVLMFKSNGLCVTLLGGPKCGITTPDAATDVSGKQFAPSVFNGNKERAERVTRGEALDWNIAELRRLITWLEAL